MAMNPVKRRSMVTHTLIYAVGTLGSQLIGFIMLPIYTRKLTPADYGIYELLSITTGVLGVVLSAGIGSAVTRFYHRYDTLPEKNRVVTTALAFMGSVMGAMLCAFLALSPSFSDLILDIPEGAYFFRLIFIAFCMDRVTDVAVSYFQTEERSGLVVLLSLIRLILGLSLNILFVVVYGMGVEGILFSGGIVAGVAFLVGVAITLRRAGRSIDLKLLPPMLRYGLPLVPATLSYLVINFGDRYFLKSYASLGAIGIYAIAYRFGMLTSTLVGSPFYSIWAPRSLVLMKEQAHDQVARTFAMYSLVVLWCWVGLSLLVADVMSVVVGPEFRAAAGLVPLIGLAYVLRSFADFFVALLSYAYRTKQIAVIRVSGALVCLALYAALIPGLHNLGAALATVGVFAYLTTMLYVYSQRATRLPYDLTFTLRVALLAAATILAGLRIPLPPGLTRFAVLAVVALAFPLIAAPRVVLEFTTLLRRSWAARLGRAE